MYAKNIHVQTYTEQLYLKALLLYLKIIQMFTYNRMGKLCYIQTLEYHTTMK